MGQIVPGPDRSGTSRRSTTSPTRCCEELARTGERAEAAARRRGGRRAAARARHRGRRDPHPRDRHGDRLFRHLARGRAAAATASCITMEMNLDRAQVARDNFAPRRPRRPASVIVGDAQRMLAQGGRPLRPDLPGQRARSSTSRCSTGSSRCSVRAGCSSPTTCCGTARWCPGYVAEPKKPAEDTRAIKEFNERINTHPALMTTTVPLRDGVAISVKRSA